VTAGTKLAREGAASWPDERLISECLKGNEQAWSALIDKYKNLIYSIPVKMGMQDEAADIFQAVCLDLLSDLPRLREPRALPKWLMQACYHKCLHYRRKSQKHLAAPEADAEGIAADVENAPLPDHMLCEVEKEQMVRDALTELSPRCERMVRMLFFENPPRPYQEIARELDLATGSIGFIRGRCLEKLKKYLEKMGF
jgi:RNA polymerase sigma factor (sigma-70 family)